MKVLVDTNVVLDVLLNRENFCKDSTVILYQKRIKYFLYLFIYQDFGGYTK